MGDEELRFTLRMPASLVARLIRLANRDGRSKNEEICWAVQRYADFRDARDKEKTEEDVRPWAKG